MNGMTEEDKEFLKQAKKERISTSDEYRRLMQRMNYQKPPYTWGIFPIELSYLRSAIEEFTKVAHGSDGKMVEYMENLSVMQYHELLNLHRKIREHHDWEKILKWCNNYDPILYDIVGDVYHFLEMLDTLFSGETE